ncbi:MAG: hypothetical protein U0X39_11795 [Bacteroidales bacterium]
MKNSITGLFLTFMFMSLGAQDLSLPEFKAAKPEDYTSYETDVLRCINWFTSTPVNVQEGRRKEAYAFFMKWLTGTPFVSVNLTEKIVTFTEPNGDLLFVFMGGWTKYAIETRDNKNVYMGNLKGIESVLEFYTRNRDFLAKDKNVEKYLRMKEKGTLEEFIKANLE